MRNTQYFKALWLGAALFTFAALGVETPASSTAVVAPVSKPAKWIAGIEIRPSFVIPGDEYNTQNYAQMGYQLGSGAQFVFRQEFRTNLYNPKLAPGGDGMHLSTDDAFFRARVNDVYALTGSLSLNYEGRLYLPTNAQKRDAGMITAMRNYARFRAKLSPTLSLFVEEIPILHAYSQPGAIVRGKAEANPIVENRVVLAAEWVFASQWKLFFPLTMRSTRYRDYAPKAKHNDAWAHKLYFWPEVVYALSPTLSLGAAFMTESLVKADFSDLNFAESLKRGTAQIILSAQL